MDTQKQPAPSATVRTARSAWQGVPLALGLAVALMLLSFIRLAGNTQTALFHTDVLDSVFAGNVLGTKLARNVAGFALALLLLHLSYGVLCLALARLSAVAWPSDRASLPHRIFLTFIALTTWLLAYNAEHFPRSSLGNPYANAMHASWLGLRPASWIGLAVMVAIAFMLVLATKKWWRAGSPHARARASIIPTALVALIAVAFAIPQGDAHLQGPARQPNVILIGIDSLRTDIVAPSTSPHVMPNLEAFLAHSASFSDATTPLARTFPSWVSILTGRDPHTTGAVVNLLPRDTVHTGATLGTMLRKAGYATAYAIDDVRFSNIDETYGFDKIVTPPIGASEFVIGFFADTPLSNMILNTSVGRVLFPFTFGNRAVAETYDPDTFIRRIATEIGFQRRPLFLATHLTLPHWPYTWAEAPPSHSDPGRTGGERWPDFYLNAARRADEQFGDLLEVLRTKGALDDAIVIVFSDHGETFGWSGDSDISVDDSEIARLEAVPTWGHGTSVFTPEQYHTVLAVRAFGSTPLGTYRTGAIDVPVSVEDITPTLAQLLALGPHEPFDGQSLLPLLHAEAGAAEALSDRIRLTETEFNPPDIALPTGQVLPAGLAAAATNYQIDPVTDRIALKRDMVSRVVHQRQFAAFGREYLLAAVPLPDGTDYRYLLVEQRSRKFQTLTGTPGESGPPEARALWALLHERFGPILDSKRSSPPPSGKMLSAASALTDRVEE